MARAPSRTEVLHQPQADQIGSLTRRGGMWSVGLIVGRQAISLCSTVFLVRLLAPSDFGLIGMVGTLTALLSVFSDAGLSWPTIQRKDLTSAQVDALFWVNVSAGFLLWGAAAALSPFLVWFYGEPALGPIVIVLGSTFAISGIAVQPAALLRRQLRLKETTLASLGSTGLGTAVAIAAAFAGFGYWAIVVNSLVASSARLLVILGVTRYRPRLRLRHVGVLPLVRFGGTMVVIEILIYFARNFDNVLIGRFWGAEELGFYTRAYFLMMLPSMLSSSVLSSVMVPALSALQADRQAFGRAYRKSLQAAALIGCPLAVGLALVSPEAVRLVYGEKWLPVVPILIWLSIAGVGQPVYMTQGWLYIASGNSRKYLIWSICMSVVIVASFIAGVSYGAIGVAVAYAVSMSVVITVPGLYLAHRAAGLDFSRSLMVIKPVFIAIGLMTSVVLLFSLILDWIGADWFYQLVVKCAIGALAYMVAVLVMVPNLPAGERWILPVRRILARTLTSVRL